LITTVIALLIGIQGSQPDSNNQEGLSASQIMSKMFAHYAEAKSAAGTIRMTQTANGVSVHTNTELQYDRPSQIFLHQIRDGSQARQWYLTSDGKEFSYDPPATRNPLIFGHKRMVEYVTQHNISMTLVDILGAASRSLGDLNPMIESAISSKDLLKKLTGQWATIVYGGRHTVNGQTVQAVSGQFRENPNSPVSGEFEAYVSPQGDFMRYVLRQRLEFPQYSRDPIEVTTTWDSDLKVGVTTDKSLYRVIP
jgi:hypothetical protein